MHQWVSQGVQVISVYLLVRCCRLLTTVTSFRYGHLSMYPTIILFWAKIPVTKCHVQSACWDLNPSIVNTLVQ